MSQIMTIRFDVTLWDCGCLNWTENNEFTYLPCGQDNCRVEKIVRETLAEEGKKLVVMEIKRRTEEQ